MTRFDTFLLTKILKAKENFPDNHCHNIQRLFDILPNFPFTTSETMCNYYLYTGYIQFASRVAKRFKTQDLKKLGDIRRVSKLHRIIPQSAVFLPKEKFC